MPVLDTPVTDARLSTTLANTIRLDRNLNRVHTLSESELEQLNRDLLTHLVRWLNGKERDVRSCTESVMAFCVVHSLPQLETAWYLQLVREGVSDYLRRQTDEDAGDMQVRANRFFDRLVCEILRA